MTTATLEVIGEVLGEVHADGKFTAQRTATADDLHLEVKGVGRIGLPVSRAQAKQLCEVARPARYGRGEETLLDRRVRDTWEVPKSRVKIDKRRWNRTLLPVLEGLREDLGLPDGCRLKAELHSMLVYAPGQFFLRHQDSEKDDEMIGTLVVTLPAAFKGGTLVVEHQGEKASYRGSKKNLAFVAFYADCHHEIRPVKEGYRVSLTYNLLLQGDGTPAGAVAEEVPETVDAVVELLHEHFETPRPPLRHWDESEPPREPASRLVYLLDHEYTERGFGWNRLKGDDATRVAVLRAAAERAGCEMMLALAEVHETWGCMEDGWDDPFGDHYRWERGEDDEWYSEEPLPTDGPDGYTLIDLFDWSITLDRWLDSSGKRAKPIVTHVAGDEVCSTTPSSELEPYAAEYEGYMGNYGNTMDRWYRRAAVVLWPRERTFAVRAEASPAWALTELKRRLRAGEVAEAREMATSLLPFWRSVAPSEERRGFFDKTLQVAEGLDRPELAASLLEPFRVEALTKTKGGTAAFVALVERYGEDWTRELLAKWGTADRRWMEPRDRLAWIASLPRLCETLCAADDAVGTVAGRLLLEDRWVWLKEGIESKRGLKQPSSRERALAELASPLLGFLEGTAVVEAGELRDEAVDFLLADENEPLLPCLVRLVRTAADTVPPERRAAMGLEAVARRCAERLEARLAQPAREEDDWSIALPEGCRCELCETLGDFLADPSASVLEWPIAKEKRRHVHRRVDDHELPVRHETERVGRPYTLVLTKKETLFERDARERRSWEEDLEWLDGWLGAGGS